MKICPRSALKQLQSMGIEVRTGDDGQGSHESWRDRERRIYSQLDRDLGSWKCRRADRPRV